MEPRPNQGNAFVYRLGNSSREFCAVNNTTICIPTSNGKYEIPAGNYTFHNNENENATFNLNMATEPKTTNFVVAVFDKT
jgi:hypothetical protein